MKIYDLTENIKLWIDLYNESSNDDKTTDGWKRGMLKVLSKLTIAEELNSTPFKQKLENIINIAKNEEIDQITYIYETLDSLNNYFQEKYDIYE